MSNETQNHKDVISLREYFERRLFDMEKAVSVAHEALGKRLDVMNEFRNQLKDQAGTFLIRDNFEIKYENLQKQIEELKLSRAVLVGKASQSAVNINLIISILGFLIALLAIFLKIAH